MNVKKDSRCLQRGRSRHSGSLQIQFTRSRSVCSAKSKSGVTLIEVLIATALVSIAVASLAQVSRMGTQTALRAQLETLAAIRCESILDEIIMGNGGEQSRQQGRWMEADWHVDTTSRLSSLPGFIEWTVTVRHKSEASGAFTLSRLRAIQE